MLQILIILIYLLNSIEVFYIVLHCLCYYLFYWQRILVNLLINTPLIGFKNNRILWKPCRRWLEYGQLFQKWFFYLSLSAIDLTYFRFFNYAKHNRKLHIQNTCCYHYQFPVFRKSQWILTIFTINLFNGWTIRKSRLLQ